MSKKEMAVQYHLDGFNCAQAVVGAFCEELGVSKEMAMQMAAGFGGGMRCQSVCGAVTGAMMVLGLKYGQTKAEDQETKMKMYGLTTEFQNRFKEQYKTLLCPELLGHDITTAEGMTHIKSQGLSRSVCDKLIEDAVELTEAFLANK